MKDAIRKISAVFVLAMALMLSGMSGKYFCPDTEAAEIIYVNPPPSRVYVQPQPRVVPVPMPPPQYRYGQRRAVPNVYEAGRIMGQYYHGRDVRIGPIVERDLFYQADVKDRRGTLVDKIILDKRTGRLRSAY